MFTFTWDSQKAKKNLEKHQVSFEEAQSIFYDNDGILIHDENHSESEDRFVLIGFSSQTNLLVVVHCYQENDQIIRIISARNADKREAKQYQRRKNER